MLDIKWIITIVGMIIFFGGALYGFVQYLNGVKDIADDPYYVYSILIGGSVFFIGTMLVI